MRAFYAVWALFCAGWGYLAAGMWPEPAPYGILEILALLFGGLVIAPLVAYSGKREGRLPKPNLRLRPWTGPGMYVLGSFTFFFIGCWALIFAFFSGTPMWGGALQSFLFGVVVLGGLYLAPVLFKSRFES